MRYDVTVLGGGIAAVWILDELVRAGWNARLVAKRCLGDGETSLAQGILHDGTKYILSGSAAASTAEYREAVTIWKHCLAGARQPHLQAKHVRSRSLEYWGDSGDSSVTDETVVDPLGVLADIARTHAHRLSFFDQVTAHRVADGTRLCTSLDGADSAATFTTRHLVVAAGVATGQILDGLGIPTAHATQRRLRMVLVKGALPPMFGHYVRSKSIQLTVTTIAADDGATIWQIGGDIAADEQSSLVSHLAKTRRALVRLVPEQCLSGAAWTAYDAHGAARESQSVVPATRLLSARNVTGAWPGKLVLAPVLARKVLEQLKAKDEPDAPAEPSEVTPLQVPLATAPWHASAGLTWISDQVVAAC